MDETATTSATLSNKAFIAEMLGQKKRLEGYPDRADPNLIMHEPTSLPFGGTYTGLTDSSASMARCASTMTSIRGGSSMLWLMAISFCQLPRFE